MDNNHAYNEAELCFQRGLAKRPIWTHLELHWNGNRWYAPGMPSRIFLSKDVYPLVFHSLFVSAREKLVNGWITFFDDKRCHTESDKTFFTMYETGHDIGNLCKILRDMEDE